MSEDDLYHQLNLLNFAETGHDESWRDQVGKEMNDILGYAVYAMETCGDEADQMLGRSVLSICNRVKEFERIRTCTREELVAMQKEARKASSPLD